MHSAIAVPIESETTQLGFLTVFGRGADPPVAGKEFQTLEAIAHHAAPTIESARHLGAVRRLPDTDGLTGIGNRQLFHETLALEVARAQRQGYRLSVCVLNLDGFTLANQRLGQFGSRPATRHGRRDPPGLGQARRPRLPHRRRRVRGHPAGVRQD